MSDNQQVVCVKSSYATLGPSGAKARWEGGRGAISIVANVTGTDEVNAYFTPDQDDVLVQSGGVLAAFPFDASLNKNHDGETSKLSYFELPPGDMSFACGAGVEGLTIVIFKL